MKRAHGVALLASAAAVVAVGAASAAVPQNTSNPTIEGGAVVGRTLTGTPGAWSGDPAGFAYMWQRCDAAGNGCGDVSRGRRYTVRQADAGHRLRLLVTASNSDGQSTVNSLPTGVVASQGAAQNTGRPSISGTAAVGQELTANRGSWNGATISFRYQWQRCDANGNNCRDLGGANGRTYGVVTADAGATLRVVVTGIGSAGSAAVTSDRTAVVKGVAAQAPPPAASANPCAKLAASATGRTVSVNDLAQPNRLLVSNVEFTPTTIRSRTTFTARFRVLDSCGRPVQGALVYATGVPFGKVQNAPEVATDSQGWATIQFTPTTRLPLVRGTALQIFVRARKSGENVLAGISTRRLVQIGIAP